MTKSPTPRGPTQKLSILWSIALVASLLLIVAGAVLIVMNAASLGSIDIALSPTAGLKVSSQSGGPILLAIGAGLLVGLAKVLPNHVRVLSGGSTDEQQAIDGPLTWRARLTWAAYLGLAIAAILLLRLYL